MSARTLDAAGIADPVLRRGYEACRRLNSTHGRTYYLSTLLLPAGKRPYVHALYGFARYTDDLVDDLGSTLPAADRAARLERWAERFRADVRAGHSCDPVVAALLDTLRRWDIPASHVDAFLSSMRMDLTVSRYRTFGDLLAYMHGSAAVIGLQVLPVLEPVVPREIAEPYAADLGIAFQLTNFIRDVGEDLRRGRVYLPLEDLAAFGVSPDRLAAGVVDGPVRRLLAFEVARARELYRSAGHGIRLLDPSSRPCIQTALALYGAILDEVEKADYAVLDRRVRVGGARRLAVAVPGLVRARAARAGRPAGGQRRAGRSPR